MVSVVIPAYNESERIGQVLEAVRQHADEVLVVDDGSTDGTGEVAESAGAKVIANVHDKGCIGALRTGCEQAGGDIIVTMDADGEHDAGDIPRLIEPLLVDKADLVLGKREEIPRISERLINWLTNFRVTVSDSGTGFRAMSKDLALKLRWKGRCTCGTLVLEANRYGARIAEVPVTIQQIPKARKIAWSHFWQIFDVLYLLVKPNAGKKTQISKKLR